MMTVWIVIFVVILFISWRMMPPKGVRSISTEALKPMLTDKKVQLIDVRSPGEYKQRHIKQFKNIPVDRLAREHSTLDKTKQTVVICQSGMRSMMAAKTLKKAGFTNIVNITGGMNAWRD